MAFFPLGPAYGGIIRRFQAAAYGRYAAPQALVLPCPAKKIIMFMSWTFKRNTFFDKKFVGGTGWNRLR
jgi:hypothetical protein